MDLWRLWTHGFHFFVRIKNHVEHYGMCIVCHILAFRQRKNDLAKPKFASELGVYPATHGERDCRAPVQGGGARQGVSCTATATGHTEGQSPGM